MTAGHQMNVVDRVGVPFLCDKWLIEILGECHNGNPSDSIKNGEIRAACSTPF